VNGYTSVLVVGAHPDDEVLGFGATGAAMARAGVPVTACLVSGGVHVRRERPTDQDFDDDLHRAQSILGFSAPILGSFPNIEMNTVPHLQLVRFIEAAIESTGADLVVTHHPEDINDDHRRVAKAVVAASRLYQRKAGVPELNGLYFMEVLSATDWTYPAGLNPFAPDTFVDASATLDLKLAALAAYRGVMREAPHPRREEVLRGHAVYRGAQAGLRYAEAFQTVFRRGL